MNRQRIVFATVMLLVGAGACFGQTVIDDPLHAFCYGTSTCADNGTNTPTTTNPPQFGFTISPGPQTGDFVIDVLVPGNMQTGITTFSITGTQGGALNNQAISATASLFSATDWTSGTLAAYLGLNASPNNGIGAFLPATQAVDAGATGFSVYQADLGTNTIADNSNSGAGPLLNIGGSPLPQGSYIVSFLNSTTTSPPWVATANSGALFIDGPPTPSVPEPASILLLATMGLALGIVYRKRARIS